MATVELSNLTKSFGKTEVIKGVDLKIEDGEFVVLIGPSGCGKSTLLRMIAGLEDISEGDLLIDKKQVNDVPARDRGISMVFQSYALYPHMSSAQNMSFSLRMAGDDASEQTTKVDRASKVLGLKDYLHRFPKELSGGQRQRVAMGRAIVRKPSVFLFDEPLSNLDAKLRVKMRAELKELHQKLKTTTIYVTHDQIEAMTLADRIVVLKDGKIEQSGTPLELYDNPVNSFVGSFLGSPTMNILDLTVNEAGQNSAHFGDGEELVLPKNINSTGAIKVGIRPESFALASEKTDTSLSADVVVVEPTGSETELLMRKGGQDIIATFRDRLDIKPGDRVNLVPDAQKIHLFEADTGLSI